jgi:hypothetical protein
MAEPKPEPKKGKTEINWTPIAVGGLVIGGIVLAWKMLQSLGSESPANQEQARIILTDWQLEFDEMKTYTETIYAGGRTPTDQEIAVLSSMLDQMKIKELTVHDLSKTVFSELKNLIDTLAADWWLVPVSVASVIILPIAGYMTYKLIKEWKNRRGPPPNFPCPKDGIVFATEGALKNHIETAHTPILAFVAQARQAFDQTSTWVQSAVAVESYYSQTFTIWSALNLPQIRNLSWGLTSAWVYGIGAASESILLRTALMLLLA